MLELLQIFADNILPILLIAGVGVYLRRGFDVDPRTVSTMMFYALSPALIFHSLVTSTVSGEEFASIYFLTIAFQVIIAITAYITLGLQGVNGITRAGVMLGAFCFNSGNYGLSLVLFAFGEEILSRAVIVYVANATTNYILGVFVASNGRRSPAQAMVSVIKTPAVYAVALAFLVNGLEITLPLALARSVERLADASIPVMLLLLGLQLGQTTAISQPRLLFTGVGLRLLFSPFLAAGMAAIAGLNTQAEIAFIVQASMPTAVLTIVFANEFDLDRELALNLIMVSTLLSPITLSILILLLR